MSNRVIQMLGRRLRLAVIGGGPGSFIGPIHRTAARLDDRFELVAACLSSTPEKADKAAADLGLPTERRYADWRIMIERESARADGAEVIAVMTPNHLHVRSAMLALDCGLDVICDKPLATNLLDCKHLIAKQRQTDRIVAVTYNYSQYPMVRQARAMVARGDLGEIGQIHLCYVQGHNAGIEPPSGRAGNWRFDPDKAGPSLILGDIGTHAYHLGAYVSGLALGSVMADIGATVAGRDSDDYACLLTRWQGGARGSLWVTSAAAGAEHGLSFAIFGDKGGLEWHQEQPNHLLYRRLGGFPELQTRRLHGVLLPAAEHAARVELGHPEGYQEAFANIYRDVADSIACRRQGIAPDPAIADFPTAIDGARGLAMIEASVESARTGCWTDVEQIS